MRILLVNKFHYLKGGSEKYYFELGQLLKEHGHEVAYFSMEDEKNIKTGCQEYFVKPIDLNSGSKMKALDVIYSRDNYKKMIDAIEDFKPDVVHINNFQRQLSASIVKACKDKKVPVIYTAHDVQAICPGITMMDNDKNVCELCKNGKYINCIKKKCNKGSTLKSVVGALEGWYYRCHHVYTKKINAIITPSEFYKTKLMEDGINENKIYAMHNFIDSKKYAVKTEDKGYALYIGRLSKEKGILNLINAFESLENGVLYIAGEGPEKAKIEQFIEKKGLTERIQLLGFLNQDEVIDQIRNCKFVVVPSIWYENCPYSILETLAIGKSVIGSNMGGIPELVKNEQNGLVYQYDDVGELKEKMEMLFKNQELVEQYGQNAREQAIRLYNKETYYEKIINLYQILQTEKKE